MRYASIENLSADLLSGKGPLRAPRVGGVGGKSFGLSATRGARRWKERSFLAPSSISNRGRTAVCAPGWAIPVFRFGKAVKSSGQTKCSDSFGRHPAFIFVFLWTCRMANCKGAGNAASVHFVMANCNSGKLWTLKQIHSFKYQIRGRPPPGGGSGACGAALLRLHLGGLAAPSNENISHSTQISQIMIRIP